MEDFEKRDSIHTLSLKISKMCLYEGGILAKRKLSIRMAFWYKLGIIELQHDFF